MISGSRDLNCYSLLLPDTGSEHWTESGYIVDYTEYAQVL